VKQLKDEHCQVVISIFEVLVSQEKFDNWSTEGRSLKVPYYGAVQKPKYCGVT